MFGGNWQRFEMADPREFLDAWAGDNVRATASDDEATAKQLAFRCVQDAKAVGLSEAGMVKAAGGNLKSFMLDRLHTAVNAERERRS